MIHFLCLYSKMSSHIFKLGKLVESIIKNRCDRGIPIPDDILQEIARLNKKVEAFLQESQKQFDSSKRNESMKQMVFLIWRIFFNNVIQKIVQNHAKFPVYSTFMANKEHAKCVMGDDIREKIRLLHEMLKSWPHLVPPQLKDINFPTGHLQNRMLLASFEDGKIEPPSLKPNIEPLSIINYVKCEYQDDEESLSNTKVNTEVKCFVRFAKNQEFGYVSDPFKKDPTFLSDVMERYGSTRYLEVCEMFPNELSEFHPEQE